MSEDPTQTDGLPEDSQVEVGEGVAASSDSHNAVDPISSLKEGWRDAWQVPSLLVAGGLLLFGIAYSMSKTPDPDLAPAIHQANMLIDNEQFGEAIELLNTQVYPYLEKPFMTQDDRAAYHLAKAQSIYYGQAKMNISDDRNDVAIIREFLEAERLGGGLAGKDLSSLANTYLARDEMDLAIQRAKEIPQNQRYLRDAVNKRIVESMLDRPVPETERAMELLADMLIDPKLPTSDRVWALETQGNVRLEQGYAEETIMRILRAMPRLERAQSDGRSRLHLILAKAYNQIGAEKQAREQINHAKSQTAAGDLHYPDVLLIQAIILDAQGEVEEARDLFSEVVSDYSNSRSFPRALLGLAETEASLDEPVLSLEAFTTLVEGYDGFGIESNPSRKEVMESLLERSGDSLSSGESADAIWYATLADRLYRGREIPIEILEALAVSHVARSEQLLNKPIDEVRSLMGLDPSLRSEVQRHLMSAATNYRMHAERNAVTNLPRYAESLWKAADLFDRAGDQREAIQGFMLYTDSMPSDPRHAEAKFRLAESLRALGDFQTAADVYSQLIEAKSTTAGADIGPFAEQSHVPLAQAYLYDEDPANDSKAEQLLRSAIDGSMGSTETSLFRDALLELAGYYDRDGQPERAIERYTEFVSRYPDDPEIGSIQFRVADAHRRLADDIEVSLQDAMPAAERNRRQDERTKNLRFALDLYQSAINQLGAKPVSRLGLFESIALRNAHFYMGDCAFDLEQFDQAIKFYDRARDQYGEDPASLVAMVQIVNAYISVGDYGRAATANERARRFYESMPPEIWDDPSLPMDRTDWEDWLNSSSVLFAQTTP